MFTIDEIKREAENQAYTVDINWDKLEDAQELESFEKHLSRSVSLISDMESLYGKITSGKSVINPDSESPLEFDELEHYAEVVAEELFSAYLLRSVYDRFQKVNNIIALSGSQG